MLTFSYACPICRTALDNTGLGEMRCPVDGSTYRCIEGIWRFLTPQAQEKYGGFIADYQAIRQAEGRGSGEAAYYRALPFSDRTGRFSADWKIRRRSYESLLANLIQPFEKELGTPLKIVDLGAGNGWLSYRLAQRGHIVAGIDLQTSPWDGLGAYVHYDSTFIPIQADFDRLPLTGRQADVIIYNASFHYSTGYAASLSEALRILVANGTIAIVDTPLYSNPSSGERMVQERYHHFRERFGIASDALPSENFLTPHRLESLANELGIRWELLRPDYGLRWALRPIKARLTGRRQPAQFALIFGKRTGS